MILCECLCFPVDVSFVSLVFYFTSSQSRIDTCHEISRKRSLRREKEGPHGLKIEMQCIWPVTQNSQEEEEQLGENDIKIKRKVILGVFHEQVHTAI